MDRPLQPTPQFLSIVFAARDAVEVTLAQLIACFPDLQDRYVIDQVGAIANLVHQCGLELAPDIADGDQDRIRLLRSRVLGGIGRSTVVDEISRGESDSREFKSSFDFDHAKAMHNPTCPLEQLKSDGVRKAVIKTIGAFLNTGGGVLYLGVADSGNCVGIEHDLKFFREDRRTFDKWELHVRDSIKSAFYEGGGINDYIKIHATVIGPEVTVARLGISHRSKLSFVLDGRNCILFRRQGNKTEIVPIQDVEEFIEYRKEHLGHRR
jgi:hypothetical protein